MTDHFNQLTPAQAERLAMLAEECAEVIQVVGKILRHGYDNYHPENRTFSNRDMLHQELTDLFAVQNEIYAQDRILLPSSETVKAAWDKKLRYAHHQAPDAGGNEEPAVYLIRKYGGYYRPNCQGYTRFKEEAGRYTLAKAISESHPNGQDGPRDGITYIHEDDVLPFDGGGKEGV